MSIGTSKEASMVSPVSSCISERRSLKDDVSPKFTACRKLIALILKSLNGYGLKLDGSVFTWMIIFYRPNKSMQNYATSAK